MYLGQHVDHIAELQLNGNNGSVSEYQVFKNERKIKRLQEIVLVSCNFLLQKMWIFNRSKPSNGAFFVFVYQIIRFFISDDTC